MKATRISAWLLAAAFAGATGCAGTGEVEYGGAVGVQSPDLVEVEPGVQVIADADEPIFYSDGAYWMYRDGFWERSNYYNNGFARVDVNYVPMGVRHIDNPRAYVHYRRHEAGRNYARPAPVQRRVEPYNREGGVSVQRGTPVVREPARAPARAPVIRDHRDDRGHDHDHH